MTLSVKLILLRGTTPSLHALHAKERKESHFIMGERVLSSLCIAGLQEVGTEASIFSRLSSSNRAEYDLCVGGTSSFSMYQGMVSSIMPIGKISLGHSSGDIIIQWNLQNLSL